MKYLGAANKPVEIPQPVEFPATLVATKRRNFRLTEYHRAEILRLHYENKPVRDISREVMLDPPTIRRVLRNAGFSHKNKRANAAQGLTEMQARLVKIGRDYVLGQTDSPEHAAEIAALQEIFYAAVNAAQERATNEAMAQFGA